MALLILALARPRMGHSYREQVTRGVDIMLVLDCSGSMALRGLQAPHRLWVAKDVVKDFIQRRPDDRWAWSASPDRPSRNAPHLDHGILLTFVTRWNWG